MDGSPKWTGLEMGDEVVVGGCHSADEPASEPEIEGGVRQV